MKKITENSSLKQVWTTPVGHDVLAKILMQMGISEGVIKAPVVRGLKLGKVMQLAKRTPLFAKGTSPEVIKELTDGLIHLINSEEDDIVPKDDVPTPAWWKEAVFYQIYPRSFKDTNGDGIGDLRGIIEKLDYLKDLGVNALWLSPIYDSPQDDNGYDIRDYRRIDAMFGTMEDFDELLAGVHERSMHLIMDLVVNHTSDEHEWFKAALADKESKYRNYYFFREAEGAGAETVENSTVSGGEALATENQLRAGAPSQASPKLPNNWDSFFSGPAWNYYPETNSWALHLFSKKQMDLNWDNPDLRADVIDMIKFWLEKGVDGFRMDVINYISKEPGLPDGNETIGSLMNFRGVEHYFYGPRMHEYFRQIKKEAFEPYNAFSVGETPGFGMKMAQLSTAEERHELDMIFSFDHLETPGHVRYDKYRYDLNYYRDYITDWMLNYGSQCWMSLFYNNHDNPRMASKVDERVADSPQLRRRIQTLLAVMQFTLRGTPFIYQGDEMGLTNYDFAGIEELQDVEIKGFYKTFLETMTPEEAWEKALCGTRDHARVLLPWNDFPADRPERLNQHPDEAITQLYKDLIALRAGSPALLYGRFALLDGRKDHFTYMRTKGEETYVVDCNLSALAVKTSFDADLAGFELLFDSIHGFINGSPDGRKETTTAQRVAAGALSGFVPQRVRDEKLAPYEARIWKKI